MSTIASPREPPRRTPNSSNRPSFETTRSITSPVLGHASLPPPGLSSSSIPQPPVRRTSNRAALREYYNLRASAPRIDLPDSEVPPSDIDDADFDADDYVNKVAEQSSLEELLRLYTRVVGEIRALDAEKKALVYDNYSKLITATETIRKMRTNMDPLNPMASTLDPAIAQIYTQASSIREALRESTPAPDSEQAQQRDTQLRRKRTHELAVEVLAVPERLRELVKEDKLAEARKQWQMPRRLLVSWKERGVGGEDVERCIEEGDEALNRGQVQGQAQSQEQGESRNSTASGRPSHDTRASRDGH